MSEFLEWVIVAFPTVIGFMQLVFPIQSPKRAHRVCVLVVCIVFSVLIWWQQRAARIEHENEFSKLPTKEDIQKLPTAGDIVKEFRRFEPSSIGSKPWGLTDEQLAKLTERVAVYAPFSAESDLITAVMGDPSSIKFAHRLAIAFRLAHWKGVENDGFGQAVFNGPIEGVIVQIRDKDDRPPGLKEFAVTLREFGIEPFGQIVPTLPRDTFHIVVGSRPSEPTRP
jgi:hypothetical protein